MARVVAIVLNWRRASETIACVSSLIQLHRDLDIVVVDNASGDGSLAAVKAALPAIIDADGGRYDLVQAQPLSIGTERSDDDRLSIRLVQTGWNGGYAFGNNVGIRVALEQPGCEFIWILNNDVVVADGASLDALCTKMDADPTVGLCGSTVVFRARPDLVQSRGGGTFNPVSGRCRPIGLRDKASSRADEAAIERRLAYVNGAAAFARRSFVDAIGPMTEDYFLFYEEIDWAWRARGRFRLGYASGSVVLHTGGCTTGADDFGNASALSRHYFARNTLKFLARHWPVSLPIALLMLLREALVELCRGHWRNTHTILLALAGRPWERSHPYGGPFGGGAIFSAGDPP